MTCTAYRRWLSPYVDGVLGAQERTRLDDHLGGCDVCRGELDSLKRMLHTLQTLDVPKAPDLLPGIHRKLQAAPWWQMLARRFTTPWPASLPLHGLALATTALLVIIVANLPGITRRDAITPERFRGGPERSLVIAKNVLVGDSTIVGALKTNLAQKPPREYGGEKGERSSQDRISVQGSEFEVQGQDLPSDSSISAPASLDSARDRSAGGASLGISPAMRRGSVLPRTEGRVRHEVSERSDSDDGREATGLSGGLIETRTLVQTPQPTVQKRIGDFWDGKVKATDRQDALNASAPMGEQSPDGQSAEPIAHQANETPAAPTSTASRAEDVNGNAQGFQAAAKTAEANAPTPAAPAFAAVAPEPLQVQWQVADVAAAASQISGWVIARKGLAVATNEHHLSIKLPASAVPEFLRQFSTNPPAAPDPTQPVWITISLELIQPL
ncbi:MAG: zf-HC2 domain-containing protein [Candidatus Omnitrophica bacterium]|nr:zf-HC2 domain-containing protein [Candidatus Omnitrophota bacterium]